ncbi:hypothetical protein K8I61_18795 [bacterium]|nr:hypothetical protein [bacterium]
MATQSYEALIPGGLRTPAAHRIIWSSMIVSVLAFGVLSVIFYQYENAKENVGGPLLFVAFSLLAVAVSMASLLMRRRGYRHDAAATLPIVSWALAESVAIFGFVLVFLGGPLIVGFLFAVWALVLLVMTR